MKQGKSRVDWIAVDWGSTHLRAWAMAGDSPRAAARSSAGLDAATPEAMETTLLRLLSPWLDAAPVKVLAAGRIGMQRGWGEIPPHPVPARPKDLASVCVATSDPRIDLHILPGLGQKTPADVMGGEAMQIAGLLVQNPTFDGVVCLAGRHSKWVRISAEEVVSFQTAMTGELFALLSRQSSLQGALGAEDAALPKPDQNFSDALADTLSRPERLSQRLFSLQAEALLEGCDPIAARTRLFGHLIGAELAATRPYWLGQDVAIIAEAGAAALYHHALSAQGAGPEIHDPGSLTCAGLAQIHARLAAKG